MSKSDGFSTLYPCPSRTCIAVEARVLTLPPDSTVKTVAVERNIPLQILELILNQPEQIVEEDNLKVYQEGISGKI